MKGLKNLFHSVSRVRNTSSQYIFFDYRVLIFSVNTGNWCINFLFFTFNFQLKNWQKLDILWYGITRKYRKTKVIKIPT